MSKKICVIGTGYVGLIAAVGLSDFGNVVTAVDIDEEKIEKLKKGSVPIYEVGLQEYLNRNMENGRLSFSTDLASAVRSAEVIFIAVGTPPLETGEADLSYVMSAVDTIAANISDYAVIVTKSTVPVGTNREILMRIRETGGLEEGRDFDVVSNPEFLREGRAIQDFFHPDRTVIGFRSERAKETMFEVYRALNLISVPFVWTNLETAELIKYASNAFLATKIAFINEMANLADAVGADIHTIAKSMGMDGRISPKFLHPGPGFGGSCFPKDTEAIASTGDRFGIDLGLIKQVIESNARQHRVIVEKAARILELSDSSDWSGIRVGLLGLAFKQETDDVRKSPALAIARELITRGAEVTGFDPKAGRNAQRELPSLIISGDAEGVMRGADVLILATEWNEFRNLNLDHVLEHMRTPNIVDARNLLDPVRVISKGIRYTGVGRGDQTNG
jgi:UDPglucose 6-dehydrogenase